MDIQRGDHRAPTLDRESRIEGPEGVREKVGAAIGVMWAPAITVLTKLRHARLFHPTGHMFAGISEPVPGPFGALGRELTGRVLARRSAALWRRGWEHLDVLGLALRFRRGPGPDLDERPRPGDQDLLTATIRSPLTMLAAPLLTDASDFAGNKYWAVSPFARGADRFELRLVPVDPPRDHQGTRMERLLHAVDAGRAVWWLQARRTLTLRWFSVSRIELTHPLYLDQALLAFDPFRGDLRPVGLVHAIRRAVYAAGQRARPRTST